MKKLCLLFFLFISSVNTGYLYAQAILNENQIIPMMVGGADNSGSQYDIDVIFNDKYYDALPTNHQFKVLSVSYVEGDQIPIKEVSYGWDMLRINFNDNDWEFKELNGTYKITTNDFVIYIKVKMGPNWKLFNPAKIDQWTSGSSIIPYGGSPGTMYCDPAESYYPATYQWYYKFINSENDNWQVIPGATYLSYTPPAPFFKKTSYMIATTVRYAPGSSILHYGYDEVTFTVLTNPSVSGSINPPNPYIATGDTCCLNLTIFPMIQINSLQWQRSINGNDWIDIVGANNYSFYPNTDTDIKTMYRVKINNNTYSTISTLNITGKITPSEIIVNNGNRAFLKFGGSSFTSGTPYWEKCDDISVGKWERLNTPSYSSLNEYVTDYLYSTTYFRVRFDVRIDNGFRAVYSAIAKVEVLPIPVVAGTIDPVSQGYISYGNDAATLNHKNSNGIISRQWQYKESGSDIWKDISGASGTSYTPKKLNSTTEYRVKINNQDLYSEIAKVLVKANPGVIQTGVILNKLALFHFQFTGVPTRQWQMKIDAEDWKDIPGATEEIYQFETLTNNTLKDKVYNFRILLESV